jgi:3-phenylpropionate/trans-cinnamate dioxygenase ferredoxin reductase component
VTPAKVVVVGTGHAGLSAVTTLRAEGFDGSVTLVGEESILPYDRPQLSKQLLTGSLPQDALLIHDAQWYEDRRITLRLGVRVAELASDGSVRLSDGTSIPADAVVLATGASPRQLPFDARGSACYLRSYRDAIAIKEKLVPGARVVIVGAGFIGAELAAAARSRDVDVVMLEMLDIPFSQVLGADFGSVLADIHREAGVDLRTGQTVTALCQENGYVVVTTSAGSRIEADFAVIGVGALPNDDLARCAGLETDQGILVDAGCQTSSPGVFAAGDAVSHDHPLFSRRVRVEHYESAIKQGAVAARNILGRGVVHADPPWFWSDQYEHNLQYAGSVPRGEQVIVRRGSGPRQFTAFFAARGRLTACFGLNRGPDVRTGLRLIGQDITDIERELSDPQCDLRDLVRTRLRASAG